MSPELEAAVSAAREAGALLREHCGQELVVDEAHAHDIKLELDVCSQKLIEGRLLAKFPGHAFYGEEGIAGQEDSPDQWVVDPIDGTVNFFYGIPHFCVSIALRREGKLQLGTIYDPMMDELYAVDFEGPPTRNGESITPSARADLGEAVVTVGFSKSKESMEAGMARYRAIAPRVRKTRMLGSAALALAYIACGRLDAYIEEQISLWDIAAGQLLLERGGGKVVLADSPHPDRWSIVASNGKLELDEVL